MQKSERSSLIKPIVLTGGGTGGHVIPHLALLKYLRSSKRPIFYIGSEGIEKQIMEGEVDHFYSIPTGKLRRYLSLDNVKDIFRVIAGVFTAFFLLIRLKPAVIFSKGGFVSVPVCWAGYLLRIPVVTQESDFTPGLATRLIAPLAKTTICAFSATTSYLPKRYHSIFVGQPVREELLQGESHFGYELCDFERDDARPVVLVMGGSQGATVLNELVVQNLASLTQKFRVVHLAGKNWQSPENLASYQGSYVSFPFLMGELKHIFAISSLVVSRAGANAIFEFLALRLPMLLIPLERGSRGDQVDNARYFKENGWAHILTEHEMSLSSSSFMSAIISLQENAGEIRDRQAQTHIGKINHAIADEILKFI